MPFESKKAISVEGPAGWAAPRLQTDRIARDNDAPKESRFLIMESS
jgi:hypothetical protein